MKYVDDKSNLPIYVILRESCYSSYLIYDLFIIENNLKERDPYNWSVKVSERRRKI